MTTRKLASAASTALCLALAGSFARGQALEQLCRDAGSPAACPKVVRTPPPPGAPVSVACGDLDDLYDSICGERDYSSATEIEISRLKGDIQDKAQNQAFKDAAGAPSDAFNRVFFLAYTRAAEKYAAEALGVDPSDFVRAGDDARRALLRAVAKHPSIPLSARNRMEGILGSVKVLLPSQYLQLPNNDFAAAEKSLRETCDYSGVATNAFSDTSWRSSVVFCPGYLVDRAVQFKKLAPQERLSTLRLVLAHEIAHQIDIGAFPWVYNKYVSCQWSASKATPEEFPGLDDRWREITADSWAAEALVLENQDAASIVRNLQGSFCGRVEGDHHPSGKFRTNVLVARQPGIRAAFGCPAAAAPRLACGMDGPSP
ncbi:MAG: hypothetical protein ACHQ49_07085 [Elusimicrobiota bacterium]